MKITAYMNLQPKHLNFDLTTGTVSLDNSARRWDNDVYPTLQAAAETLPPGAATYVVTAELTDGSHFEVRGSKDQTEGRGGGYLAGFFNNFPAAYAAAEGLGVQGNRGDIRVRVAPARVYSTVEEWKQEFDLNTARKSTRLESTDLLHIVQLDPGDAKAIGAADPEYAMWKKLNEKFGAKAGSTE